MKDYHTPLKEDLSNRKSKESRLKKPQKIAKKSLNGAFASVSEDVLFETVKESSDFSAISEISDANSTSQMAQSSVLEFNPVLSASLETLPLCDLTLTSKILATSADPGDVSMELYRFQKPNGSVEVDIVANFLKQARTRVLNSANADQQSKKLLDALVKVVLDEFFTVPEQTDWYFELVSTKGYVVFLCFLLWSLAVSVVFFFGLGAESYCGPPPT
ncbi:hypothetical protein P3X46_027938 [Hevea brasiliensis]|uniref:Uncharacterized protein n=1 Tax=Hevea brasiliensis TaxID=3981 RepID=A0ABQ9L2W6_HEVBR|nr:uncharacterized protein LOC110669423 [Hevea brasiliensis]XP_021686784.2 uncharacterized protein LOC110669423 [Hevea brasiliensis]XP_021686785.2 uncharacterized protein LOC110669423 [Hevea brasiliensis]XP_057993199.1 uncharacterized protein LOC110669423 [Hevea brasiliensis]KAJ9154619.1 hypothetical protein P3X46_027938 [Hevea brasiliensis]